MRPPKLIKPYVVSFARQVVRSETVLPSYLPTAPIHGAPFNECFEVVAAHVAKHGGSAVLGWAIWEWPKAFIEAELHSVWKNPEGQLVDVAPRPFPMQRILFVEDSKRRDDGSQVDNVRKPLTNDKDVKAYLNLMSEYFRLINKGELKDKFGVIPETSEMRANRQTCAILHGKLVSRFGRWLPENFSSKEH